MATYQQALKNYFELVYSVPSMGTKSDIKAPNTSLKTTVKKAKKITGKRKK